jgi:hypothetical protein
MMLQSKHPNTRNETKRLLFSFFWFSPTIVVLCSLELLKQTWLISSNIEFS